MRTFIFDPTTLKKGEPIRFTEIKWHPDFLELDKEIHSLGLPYQCDIKRSEELQKKVDGWLRDPDNDCLRARGDWRWQRMCQFDSDLKSLIEPF